MDAVGNGDGNRVFSSFGDDFPGALRSPWFDFLAGEGGKKTERRGETWGRARPEIKEGENPRRATQGTKAKAVDTGGNGSGKGTGSGNGRPFFASGKGSQGPQGTTGTGRQTGEKGEPTKPRNGRQMVSLSFGGESLRLGLSFLPQKLALGHANQPPRRLPRIDSGRIRANRFESRGPSHAYQPFGTWPLQVRVAAPSCPA